MKYERIMGVVLIAGFAVALYLPFLSSPAVFDDGAIFSGQTFAYYATHPIGMGQRVPAYFTLAFTEMMFSSMRVHRLVSLSLHIACALVLYKLIFDILLSIATSHPRGLRAPASPALMALAGAAIFVLHPVAVYGAGYLIQRTIVMASLFSMLSLLLFFRGLMRKSHSDALSGALMYSLAVLCKEHSLLTPAAAMLLIFVANTDKRFAIRHAAVYALACLPAAVFVILLAKGVIANAYEPDFQRVAAQMQGDLGAKVGENPLWISVINQAGLFFKYIGLWLWPAPGSMAVDIRVDFTSSWPWPWMDIRIAAFAAFAIACILLLRSGGAWTVMGFGLLYTWMHFLVEFSAARFQEPFVLYRSYLWAPGLMIALAATLSMISRAGNLLLLAVILPPLGYIAHDRLVTFSRPLLLWEDAVSKLPSSPVPYGSRTIALLIGEYLKDQQPSKAIQFADRCIVQYPATAQCYFARGVIALTLGENERALHDLSRARELYPDFAITYDRIGLALENLGKIEEAKSYYRQAVAKGYHGSEHRLNSFDKPGVGLLPPKRGSMAESTSRRP